MLTLFDYLLLPIYLIIIYIFANRFREKHYPVGHPWRRYFLSSLFLKIAGAVFITLLYNYYYGYGDTIHYFSNIEVLNKAFIESPVKWFNLVLGIPSWYEADYAEYISKMDLYHYGGNTVVVSVGAVLSIFALHSFLITAVLFAVLSFTGIWALFRVFAKEYPALHKQLGYAILYFPSVVIWGSGIFKDTLCMFGLGWITYTVFYIIRTRTFNPFYFFLLLGLIYFISVTKLYIVAAFTPAIIFWLIARSAKSIKNGYLRFIATVLAPILVLVTVFALASAFQEELGGYSLETVANTSQQLRTDLLKTSIQDDGSAYTLGNFGNSPLELLLVSPLAVNVTLFRPYPWESGKLIILLNSIESLVLLILFMYVILKTGFGKTIAAIRKNPDIQFCLLFTAIFAFAVGISTYNFGTLSRYKIPCLPFFGIALALIFNQSTLENERNKIL